VLFLITWFKFFISADHFQVKAFYVCCMISVVLLTWTTFGFVNLCLKNADISMSIHQLTPPLPLVYFIHLQYYYSYYTCLKNYEKRLLDALWLFILLWVCMEKFGSHQTDFREIWYLCIFKKSVENIQVWLKCEKNDGQFTWAPMYNY
jgi:hypothetical protein